MNAPGIQKDYFEELKITLPPLLPAYLHEQRWFGGKARPIQSVELTDAIPFRGAGFDAFILVIRVAYNGHDPETYVLPMLSHQGTTIPTEPDPARLEIRRGHGKNALAMTNALGNEAFLTALLEALRNDAVLPGARGKILTGTTSAYKALRRAFAEVLKPRLMKVEQSNSSIVYGDRLILKCFRRLENGVNPDLEMGLFLTEKTTFSHIPRVAGWLEYRSCDGKAMTLGILHEFVHNRGDAWHVALDSVTGFLPKAMEHNHDFQLPAPVSPKEFLEGDHHPPPSAMPLVGGYLDSIGLLAKRTAELHKALASKRMVPAFAAEPYTASFEKSMEAELQEMTARTFELLERKMGDLPAEIRGEAEAVRKREAEVAQRFHATLSEPITAMRTRIHGDYHLGQVLTTGNDFVIIDFEGEPSRPICERRTKRCPLQDVASMLRSFHYVALAPLLTHSEDAAPAKGDNGELVKYAESWHVWMAEHFLKTYVQQSAGTCYLPANRNELSALLQLHLLEKSIYELGYELNHRPEWVSVPLAGISRILAPAA